jgi:hypothetical protein
VVFKVPPPITSAGHAFDVNTAIGDEGTSGVHVLAVSVYHNKERWLVKANVLAPS